AGAGEHPGAPHPVRAHAALHDPDARALPVRAERLLPVAHLGAVAGLPHQRLRHHAARLAAARGGEHDLEVRDREPPGEGLSEAGGRQSGAAHPGGPADRAWPGALIVVALVALVLLIVIPTPPPRPASSPRSAAAKARSIRKWSFETPASVARILPLSRHPDPRLRELAV